MDLDVEVHLLGEGLLLVGDQGHRQLGDRDQDRLAEAGIEEAPHHLKEDVSDLGLVLEIVGHSAFTITYVRAAQIEINHIIGNMIEALTVLVVVEQGEAGGVVVTGIHIPGHDHAPILGVTEGIEGEKLVQVVAPAVAQAALQVLMLQGVIVLPRKVLKVV